MSTDSTNLEEMVEKTLESNGVLPKIRAELRANVFHLLEKGSVFQNKLNTHKIQDFVSRKNGLLLFSLVNDLFEYLELTFTKSVFDPETGAGHQYQYKDKKEISDELLLSKDDKRPLLLQILETYQSNSNSTDNIVKNHAPQLKNKTNDESPLAQILKNNVESAETVFDNKSKNLSPIKINVFEQNIQFDRHSNASSLSSSNNNLLDKIQMKDVDSSESLNSLSIEKLSPIKRPSIDKNDNSDNDVKSELKSNKNESSLEDIETEENVSYGNDSLPSTDLSTEWQP